jgi:hypothetical protein
MIICPSRQEEDASMIYLRFPRYRKFTYPIKRFAFVQYYMLKLRLDAHNSSPFLPLRSAFVVYNSCISKSSLSALASHSCTYRNTLLRAAPTLRPAHRTRSTESVFRKCSAQRLLTRNLLTPDKALYTDRNRAIDICTITIFAEPHLGERLSNSENRLEMSDLNIS